MVIFDCTVMTSLYANRTDYDEVTDYEVMPFEYTNDHLTISDVCDLNL